MHKCLFSVVLVRAVEENALVQRKKNLLNIETVGIETTIEGEVVIKVQIEVMTDITIETETEVEIETTTEAGVTEITTIVIDLEDTAEVQARIEMTENGIIDDDS